MNGAKVSKKPSAMDTLIDRWKKVLDGFFGSGQVERIIQQIVHEQLEAEEANEKNKLPTAPPSQRINITRSFALQRALDKIASAAEEIRNDAASAGIDLNALKTEMGNELTKRRSQHNKSSNRYRTMPKKTWDNRYYELFFRIFVECTHIFNDFLNQLFAPPPPDEDQSSCKDFRKSLVVKVVWERKTVRFKVPVPKPPPSGKKYTCNGYHHKPGCTCGWGPRPGSGQGKAAVKTVTKKIWVPAVYIVPAGQKPPVVI